jgi:hypothetical protein
MLISTKLYKTRKTLIFSRVVSSPPALWQLQLFTKPREWQHRDLAPFEVPLAEMRLVKSGDCGSFGKEAERLIDGLLS